MADSGKIGHMRGGRQTNSMSSSLSIFLINGGIKVFQACVAVNVETGDMFLRITQNGLVCPSACRAPVR